MKSIFFFVLLLAPLSGCKAVDDQQSQLRDVNLRIDGKGSEYSSYYYTVKKGKAAIICRTLCSLKENRCGSDIQSATLAEFYAIDPNNLALLEDMYREINQVRVVRVSEASKNKSYAAVVTNVDNFFKRKFEVVGSVSGKNCPKIHVAASDLPTKVPAEGWSEWARGTYKDRLAAQRKVSVIIPAMTVMEGAVTFRARMKAQPEASVVILPQGLGEGARDALNRFKAQKFCSVIIPQRTTFSESEEAFFLLRLAAQKKTHTLLAPIGLTESIEEYKARIQQIIKKNPKNERTN